MPKNKTESGLLRTQHARVLPWFAEAVRVGNRFSFRQKKPWIHNAINLSCLGLILFGAAGLMVLGGVLPWYVYLPFAVPGFGLVCFALIILVVHEACHQMFLIGHPKRLTEAVSNGLAWCVTLPLGIDYRNHWQGGHLTHHLEALEASDPQNCVETISTGRALLKRILLALIPGYTQFVYTYLNCPAYESTPSNRWVLMARYGSWLVVMPLLVWSVSWSVPVAIFLGFQVLDILNEFKIAFEHGGRAMVQENQHLRSTTSIFPLRRLMMPFNISLHFEHHVNFNVPWYSLMAYHKALQAVLPEDVKLQVFKYGFEALRTLSHEDMRGQVLASRLKI